MSCPFLGSATSNLSSPRRALVPATLDSSLNAQSGFRVSHPDDSETRAFLHILDPDEIPSTHFSTDARQQSSTKTQGTRGGFLREALARLISSRYRYEKVLSPSMLMPSLYRATHAFPICLSDGTRKEPSGCRGMDCFNQVLRSSCLNHIPMCADMDGIDRKTT